MKPFALTVKPFAFILASAFVLTAIHAYATPTYGGPLGASAGFDLNSIEDSIAPLRLVGRKGGNVFCGNGIGNIGYCNDIDIVCYRYPVVCGFEYR
jgi:hypothetical protein